MPEIKHNFTKGKMNKDLDERLVPNGEYTDAMNIQVSTSEGSDVGTVQNILGNKLIPINIGQLDLGGDGNGVVVASIADEKSDTLYYFIWTPGVDYIVEYSKADDITKPVLVDKNKDVLKFRKDLIITGINIIDDMLFWTDNINEPRKINITRCKQGTPKFEDHTLLVNDAANLLNTQIDEKHITVIKEAPRKPLDMVVNISRDLQKTYTGVVDTSLLLSQANSFYSSSRSNFQGLNATDNNIFDIIIDRAIDSSGNEISIGNINDNDGLTGWHKANADYTSASVRNNIPVGTKIVFAPFDSDGSQPGLPVTDFVIKGVVEDAYPTSVGIPATVAVPPVTATVLNQTITITPGTPATPAVPPVDADGDQNTYLNGIRVRIISIDGIPPLPESSSGLKYVVDLWEEEEKLFEFKFPRFSYRYKYEDGEYSAFAPFTQVAFLPGAFDYHPRKGYNLGMTNRASNVELSRFITQETPKDVVAVDILFKEEVSPNIYVVDTIRPDEYVSSGNLDRWSLFLGDVFNGIAPSPYRIEREQVESVVPSNQLLRPYDNVPRRALAQDVTGNRIVYANYLQNYNLQTVNKEKYTPDFDVTFNSVDINLNPLKSFKDNIVDFPSLIESTTITGTSKSIKSLREYQLGVVFTDGYGRETPVISNSTGTIKLEKTDADKANSIKAMLKDFDSSPEGLTHFKFYVKETSGEYYNMAMDRFYDAEDGNVWLAFPSSDRNKIDIDTFLILKKGADQDTLVKNAARYKVISIENEAPDFIKTTRTLAVQQNHTTGNDLFINSSTEIPVIGNDSFKMEYLPFGSGPGRDLDRIDINSRLYIEFGDGTRFSKRYKIELISHDDPQDSSVILASPSMYYVQLAEPLGDDVNFVSNDPTGAASSSINFNTTINIYKYTVENSPKFDGRFFVKIYEDDTFTSNIGGDVSENFEFRTVASKKIYSMSKQSDHIEKHYNKTGKFLSKGASVKANILTNTNIYTYFKNTAQGTNMNRYYYGYYCIDEFASMATYFRRMITESPTDVKHLIPTNSSAAGAIEYAGSYWKPHPNWSDEFNGYTANWETVTGGSNGSAKENRNVSADNPIDTDVWFIDGGPAAATRSTNDQLSWDYLSGITSVGEQLAVGTSITKIYDSGYESILSVGGGYKNQNSLSKGTEDWNMQLSYGGIFGSTDSPQGPTDFFNTGFYPNSDINPYYVSNNKNSTFAQQIKPGSTFVFREDPLKTQYTFGASMTQKRLIRHSSRKLANVWTTLGGTLDTPNLNPGATSMAEDLSFNFTNGINCRKITPALSWNPMTNGKISGGFEITLKAANTSGILTGGTVTATGTALADDLSIYVNTLTGDNTGGGEETASITVGMALQKYTPQIGGASQVNMNAASSLTSAAQEFFVIREIVKQVSPLSGFQLKLGGYTEPFTITDHALAQGVRKPLLNSDLVFVQVGMNGYSHNSEFNINVHSRETGKFGAIAAVGYNLDFIKVIEPENILSENPAIWETEPKETKDLDIYYEASPAIPITVSGENFEERRKMISDAIPVGSIIEAGSSRLLVVGYNQGGNSLGLFNSLDLFLVDTNSPPDYSAFGIAGTGVGASSNTTVNIKIIRRDGLVIETKSASAYTYSFNALGALGLSIAVDPQFYTTAFTLPYHNCYSFGNGVESNRIRDNFNLPFISNGVRVSTTLEDEYKEERRKYGLIYSGIYNSIGSTNNLNQFIAAEKITKDVNPIYGSIQKLHSRDTDLVTLCEDKVLRILANKDAVFNADGNPQLTATENVLGQTVPFSGEYGISTNPESFASEAYRAYFTDKVRGSVLRLSRDGLTPISDYGMKDWFRDNLKLNDKILGSYDDKKDEYNITLNNSEDNTPKTVSFKENVKGWVSFKSFTPENALSMGNDYYTFNKGKLYKHHDETVSRNTFYDDEFTPSSVEVVLNDSPSNIKTFHTLNYEGSRAKNDKFSEKTFLTDGFQPTTTYNDQSVYNLYGRTGWYVENIFTNKEDGYVSEFIEKEGKWFNNINKNINIELTKADSADFTFQGIGLAAVVEITEVDTTEPTTPPSQPQAPGIDICGDEYDFFVALWNQNIYIQSQINGYGYFTFENWLNQPGTYNSFTIVDYTAQSVIDFIDTYGRDRVTYPYLPPVKPCGSVQQITLPLYSDDVNVQVLGLLGSTSGVTKQIFNSWDSGSSNSYWWNLWTNSVNNTLPAEVDIYTTFSTWYNTNYTPVIEEPGLSALAQTSTSARLTNPTSTLASEALRSTLTRDEIADITTYLNTGGSVSAIEARYSLNSEDKKTVEAIAINAKRREEDEKRKRIEPTTIASRRSSSGSSGSSSSGGY